MGLLPTFLVSLVIRPSFRQVSMAVFMVYLPSLYLVFIWLKSSLCVSGWFAWWSMISRRRDACASSNSPIAAIWSQLPIIGKDIYNLFSICQLLANANR